MSLKELTKENHTAAEKTKFMQAVFKRKIPLDIWADFLYQKSLFYIGIESCAQELKLIDDVPNIRRAFLLREDYQNMNLKDHIPSYNDTAIEYYRYIMSIYPSSDKIMAHLYTWHMGDLHGGQMIKKVISAPHSHLDFDNREEIIQLMHKKLHDGMADEANVAFSWAIKIMEEYDQRIDI
jgi:heme oxygenase